MSQILNRELDQDGVGGQRQDDTEFETLVRGKDGSFAGNEERAKLVDEGDIVKEVSEERGERRGKGRGRRIGVGVFVLLVLAVIAVAAWYVVGNGATRKAKVAVTGNSGSSNPAVESEAALTQRAIDEARVSDRGVVMGDGSVVRPA